jgi:DNA polymerase III subunit gamma/tau
MSYQVIARKYRPQTFSDLTGQEHITRTLSHALDNQRLHHAYLFSGVRGTGKTTTARILAKGLNCHRGITSQPCLECASCLEIAAGNSLDVLEIDAASNTGVDNVRDVIINNLAMAPARDRYKIFVIDEVHMLSTSAFNALLKTLEEPPPHVVFIMATTELHKVPDTILSRCQQFEFRQIPTEKIIERLREIANIEGITIDDGALREISRAGAGSLRDAQSYFDQVIAASGPKITTEDVSSSLGLLSAATLGRLVEAIARQDTAMTLNLVEEISSRGYDLRNVTRELMAYLRHLLIVKSGIVSSDILGVADLEIDRIKELSRSFSEEDLVRSFHLLAQTEREIKDSPHPRFQLEIGLVKLTHVARLRSLDELIKRLESLESQAGKPSGEVAQPTPPPQKKTDNIADDNEAKIEVNTEDNNDDDYDDHDTNITAAVAASAPQPTKVNEVEAVLQELQKLNRGLVLTALEDAQKVDYRDGVLVVTFTSEDLFARRLRDSNTLFRDIGERLFGRPLRVEVQINSQTEPEQVDDAELARRKLHERAMNNPAVRRILEQTRGEIVWVKEQ